jgi:hypothetical protein
LFGGKLGRRNAGRRRRNARSRKKEFKERKKEGTEWEEGRQREEEGMQGVGRKNSRNGKKACRLLKCVHKRTGLVSIMNEILVLKRDN